MTKSRLLEDQDFRRYYAARRKRKFSLDRIPDWLGWTLTFISFGILGLMGMLL